jgi:hypothetical protein
MKKFQLKLLISEIVRQAKLSEADTDEFSKDIKSQNGTILYLQILDIANMDDPPYRVILAVKRAIEKKIKDPTEFQAFVGVFNREFGGSYTGKQTAWEYFTPEGLQELAQSINEGELTESGKLKALAAAGLIGYAGLHTPFGQQALAKAGQTPMAQKISQAMKPVSVSNPNEPLPDEKNMNAWDLANKYVNRNAYVEKKTAPFVKKYLPPITKTAASDKTQS